MIREADKDYIVLHGLFILNREKSAAPFMLGQFALIKLLIAIAVFILEYQCKENNNCLVCKIWEASA